MKLLYIALILIVVIGGITLLTGDARAPITPPTDTQNDTTPPVTPTAQDHGMTAEEHAAMTQATTTPGTDVGMELPETDMTTMDHSAMNMKVDSEAKMFMVNGSNFVFDVKEIRVKEGDTVTIHFMSADGFHDLVIDEFNARTEKLQTGGMSMVTFVANKKGTFEYYCSVGSHRAKGMVGKLIVE